MSQLTVWQRKQKTSRKNVQVSRGDSSNAKGCFRNVGCGALLSLLTVLPNPGFAEQSADLSREQNGDKSQMESTDHYPGQPSQRDLTMVSGQQESGAFLQSQREKRRQVMEEMTSDQLEYYKNGRQEGRADINDRVRTSRQHERRSPGRRKNMGNMNHLEDGQGIGERGWVDRQQSMLDDMSSEQRKDYNKASPEQQKLMLRAHIESRSGNRARFKSHMTPAQQQDFERMNPQEKQEMLHKMRAERHQKRREKPRSDHGQAHEKADSPGGAKSKGEGRLNLEE